MKNKIKSGYTKEIYDNMVHWYGENAYGLIELEELTEGKPLEDMLLKLKPLNFYVYIIRYLIDYYYEKLDDICEKQNLKKNKKKMLLEEAYREIEEETEEKVITKRLADLIYEDFKVTCKKGSDILKKWSKSKILQKISQKKISSEEFYQLAIGIHMPYQDVEKFLQDVLKKGGVDFWNIEELLYYVCIHYPIENKFQFWEKKRNYYEIAKPEKAEEEEENINTKWIGNEIDKLLQKMEQSFTGIFNEKAFDHFLCNYKYWVTNSSQYMRTGVHVFRRLLKEFMEISEEDREMVFKARKVENNFASGYVTVYYDGNQEIVIPEKTIFLKENKGKTTEYESTQEIIALPQKSILKSLKVICTRETEFHERETDNIGYVPKKTTFQCKVPGVLSVINKSMFKAGKRKKGAESKVKISGNVDIMAKPGTVIEEGTIFTVGETEFIAMEKLKFRAEVLVPVVGKQESDEAKKDEITKILTSFAGKENIIGLSNKKIGLIVREGTTKGKFCGYLYQRKSDYGDYGKEKGERLGELLENVLEGTEITPTRLNIIESQTDTIITRNELLTIAALHSMGISQFYGNDSGVVSKQKERDYILEQLQDSKQKIDEELIKCGFQPLYLANPYDCFIIYIAAAYEPIDVFRDLWGVYLNYKENLKEK